MKIELKSIKFSEALSEETNAFTANLYINGKLAGYCKNQGHGGCTDYYGIEKHSSDIIKEAEAYCKAQPDIDFGTFTVPNNLEHTIDLLLEDWLKAKEAKKLERKMKTCVLVGIPDNPNYGVYNFKRPLSSLPVPQLQASIGRIKAKLHEGEVILNTNLKALGVNV